MSSTADYKVTRARDGAVIAGKTVSALASKPQGTLVRTKNPTASATSVNDDTVELELCEGKGPIAVLERDILANGADIPLTELMFDNELLTPVRVGNQASARIVEELEVEGADLVQASGGQALSGSTAVDSELTALGGKWALRTNRTTQELCGRLRGFIAPVHAGNVRLLVEVCHGGLQTA